jgi:hypothetical protein
VWTVLQSKGALVLGDADPCQCPECLWIGGRGPGRRGTVDRKALACGDEQDRTLRRPVASGCDKAGGEQGRGSRLRPEDLLRSLRKTRAGSTRMAHSVSRPKGGWTTVRGARRVVRESRRERCPARRNGSQQATRRSTAPFSGSSGGAKRGTTSNEFGAVAQSHAMTDRPSTSWESHEAPRSGHAVRAAQIQ